MFVICAQFLIGNLTLDPVLKVALGNSSFSSQSCLQVACKLLDYLLNPVYEFSVLSLKKLFDWANYYTDK